jgi:DNA-binding LacI/PurR family transcriptional regulator
MHNIEKPLSRACQVLQEEIDKAHSRGRARLPSILRLAQIAGVAYGTMRKAVAQLKREANLQVKQSRGITIHTDPAEHAPVHRGPSLRWQRLKDELYRDLINGAYGYGAPLPSRKELVSRYAVSNKTLDKALRALHTSGVLVTHKRSFLLAYSSPKAKQDTIILFARGSTRDQLARFVPRITEYFYALERVCLAHNVQLQVVRYYMAQSRYVFDEYNHDSFTEAVDIARVLGFVIWQICVSPEFPLWLAEWVVRFDKPIAYYLDIYDKSFVLPRSDTGLVRCFGTESDFEAGRRMGQYLLTKGHRRIACFYNNTGQLWQPQRLDGLRSAFEEGGVEGGVILKQGPDVDENALQMNLETSVVFPALDRGQHVRYRLELETELDSTIARQVIQKQVYQSLVPLMKEAVDDRSITAWVGINDDTALGCVRFLKSNGIRVPGAVSVIGFDNSFEAAAMQMSSYDFNGAGAMRIMVDYLLRPNTPFPGGSSHGPLLLKGSVHERGTT